MPTLTTTTAEMSALKIRLKATWESGDYRVFATYFQVTGLDLAANLVQQTRTKAAAEGLTIQVDEGDAEDLPYPDASFDVVMSLIGAMFAPRPERVASEMYRVCRPGGNILMGNCTPEGHIGQMFKVIGKHVPPPPYFPSPLLWGDDTTCRQRLGAGVKV